MQVSINRLKSGDKFQLPGVKREYTFIASLHTLESISLVVDGRKSAFTLPKGQLVTVKELPYRGFAKR